MLPMLNPHQSVNLFLLESE